MSILKTEITVEALKKQNGVLFMLYYLKNFAGS